VRTLLPKIFVCIDGFKCWPAFRVHGNGVFYGKGLLIKIAIDIRAYFIRLLAGSGRSTG
jgi:hypothetical protein